ncbi:MAG: hypothetical protein CGU28_16455 [Candidatus Dactylopiibacterium carminicum]|uniref:Ketopantoate reductase N-terminal domain-containing protein n=1 Tax=Candidatus Dactylopiibacterium carminicum TaxID=857335 RepID=A0A272EMV4_9RHOO|nr:hypothetical protein BGI27_16540 [Candidatus Dactylopiibacterium carminicum]PAS91439.1 MAG: hypothetical protein CGU29_16495 [Candidatus Dactylopiibacterium carminicum]PAS92581.1 MAG: hypothetical protein CGU28_16455 [Candidatus Dactylopiibacterium carminicum]
MSTDLQRIHFIGLGAIGLKYAARLQDLDPALVRIIADKRRIAAFQANPPVVNGRPYDFRFVSPGNADMPADLLFVAVKARQLPQALEDLRGFIGPHTSVISLMNGITSEEIIGKAIGHEHVLYPRVHGCRPRGARGDVSRHRQGGIRRAGQHPALRTRAGDFRTLPPGGHSARDSRRHAARTLGQVHAERRRQPDLRCTARAFFHLPS